MRPSGALGLTTPSRNDKSAAARSSAQSPAPAAPSAAIKLIASVVANVTLLTGLLVWFGLLYTQVFFEFFRVHPSVLDQPTEDILARGVDGLFVPFAVLAAASLLGLCGVRYLRARLPPRTWAAVLRVGTPVAAVAGLTLVVLAAVAVASPDGQLGYPGLAGLALAVGVLLLLAAWRRVGTAGVVEWVLALLLVVVGLFWAVSDYSQAVGVQRAWETAQGVRELPDLVLYSQKSLNLTVDGVHESVCSEADADYRYRYDGLKLLLQSGGQYILLPAGWTPATGTTIVLPRTDAVRLEFLPAGTRVLPCGTGVSGR